MRWLAAALAAGLLGLASVGCGATAPPGAPGPERPTGSLTILGTAQEEYVRGMARAFELDTGVRTRYVRLSAGDALDRLASERATTDFSVWWGGSVDNYVAAAEQNLLRPYTPKGSSKIPGRYKDPDGNWTGIWVGVLGIGVNTRVLAERGLPEPASWADLTQPVYQGLIALAHPATSGTAYTMLSSIIELHGRQVEPGLNYFRALNPNIRAYPRSGAEPAQMAGWGEVAVGIAFAHDIVGTLESGSGALKLVFPQEGTGYEIGAMALLRNAPAPELGKQFMDWAISERAQELGPLFTAYQIPTNPDSKVPPYSVRLSSVTLIDHDFRWAGEQRQVLVDRFSAVIAPPPL